jgi:hypothetical protein
VAKRAEGAVRIVEKCADDFLCTARYKLRRFDFFLTSRFRAYWLRPIAGKTKRKKQMETARS